METDQTDYANDKALGTRFLTEDPCSLIYDIREYDVPYLARVCIDLNIRVGCWYEVSSEGGIIQVKRQEHILTQSNPKVFAFDIEILLFFHIISLVKCKGEFYERVWKLAA